MPPKKVNKTQSSVDKAPKKQEKNHTKFNDSIFKLHPYFNEIISADPQDEFCFIYELCKAHGARPIWKQKVTKELQKRKRDGVYVNVSRRLEESQMHSKKKNQSLERMIRFRFVKTKKMNFTYKLLNFLFIIVFLLMQQEKVPNFIKLVVQKIL